MGSITFQVVGDASVGSRSKTFTVPDEHINRLVAFAKAEFSPVGGPLSTPLALLEWAERLMKLTRKQVLAYEDRVAHGAVPPPPPFEAT